MNSPFTRLFIKHGFRIGLAIILLISILYYIQKQSLQTSFTWVLKSSHIQEVLTDLSQASYYADHPSSVEFHLNNLKALTSDNPKQQSRLERLSELALERSYLAHLKGQRTEREQDKLDQLNEDVQLIIGKMRMEEAQILSEREKISRKNIMLLDIPILIGGLLACILIYLAHRITRRDLDELQKKDKELFAYAQNLKISRDGLEMQTNFMELTMDAMAEGVVLVDEKRRYLRFNPVSRRIFGLSLEELNQPGSLEKLNFKDINTRERFTVDQYPLGRSLRGEVLRDFEFICEHPSGEQIIIHCNSQPIYSNKGRLIGALGVMRDITHLKNYEAELRKAQKAAIETAETKSRFLANMSHEIRTPMNGIVGMAELLNETQMDEKQRSYVNLINESSQHLLTIVNDILDFSKIEAGKLEIEKTDFEISDSIERSVHILMPKAREKSLDLVTTVSPKIPSMVRGDSGRVGQILVNLISNALKFTHTGKVTVDASLLRADENLIEVKFVVKDTGIGIDPENLQKLFHPFTQADTSTSRRFGGTGLGLSICKELVGLMNGEIGVRSSVGKGSEFWFTIPFEHPLESSQALRKDVSLQTKEFSDSARQFRKLRILLAEDNTVNQLIAQSFLKEMGHSVHTVANGLEVLEALRKSEFDLILMDCQMPEMDGVKATEEIRSRISKTLPIIAITASAMKEDEERCRQAGMNGYLSKPFNKEGLQEVLAKYLPQDDHSFDSRRLDAFRGIKDEQDQDLRISLISTYLSSAPESLNSLSDLYRNDPETFKRHVHTLKSSTASVGGAFLASLFEEIENHNSSESVENKIFQARLEFSKLRGHLESYLRQITQSSGQSHI